MPSVRPTLVLSLLLFLSLGCSSLSAPSASSGQATGSAQPKSAFFKVKEIDGRWWFIDPQGQPFFAKAVNCVDAGAAPAETKADKPQYSGLKHYPTRAAWTKAQLERLKSWGYNTLGGYSDTEIYKDAAWPYTLALAWGATLSVPWLDPLSEENKATLKTLTENIKPYAKDPNLIGYFIDNELGWWDESMLSYWFTKGKEERLKRELLKLLKEEYQGDLARLQKDIELEPAPKAWADLEGAFKKCVLRAGARPLSVERFTALYAREYYALLAAAVRSVDPDHLLLGDRYLSYYAPAVAAAAGEKMDVVTSNFNTYDERGWVSPAFFDNLYATAKRPIMVTEFYFSAQENASENPNLHGPFIKVQTQKERAKGAGTMVRIFSQLPYLVGHHWFQYHDEPKFGRGDGEDFNFGLIDNHDKPYPELTAALAEAHFNTEKEHAAAKGFQVRTPGSLPRAGKLNNDGYLGDWNLGAAWLGHAPPSPRAPSPADFYAAWTPEGLWLSAVFPEFDTSPAMPGVPGIDIKLSRGGKALAFKVSGYTDAKTDKTRLIGNGPRFPALELKGAAPLKGSKASREAVSLTSLAEIFLSAEDLGGPLKEGETLELEMGLTLKGAQRQWTLKKGSQVLGGAWGEE